MKFLIDSHLPKKLSTFFKYKGFDSVHTSDITKKSKSTDAEINSLSIHETRILFTKDIDFYQSFLLKSVPYKLVIIKTGNIKNSDLILLLDKNLFLIIEALNKHDVVEINQKTIIGRL